MSGSDPLDAYAPSAISGCRLGGTITPSDTVDLVRECKAIRSSSGGNIAFLTAADQTNTPITVTVAANETFDMFHIKRVMVTNTTATGIIGGWD